VGVNDLNDVMLPWKLHAILFLTPSSLHLAKAVAVAYSAMELSMFKL